MGSSPSSDPIITSTGWRIVGRNAQEVAARTASGDAPPPPPRVEAGEPANLAWAVSCTVRPRKAGVNAVDRILEALAVDLRKAWPGAPLPRRDEAFEHPATRFGGVVWRVDPQPGRAWRGEAFYRTVHPRVAGAPLTTRVLIEEMPSFIRLSVQVWADYGLGSIRADVGTGQATPAFVEALHDTLEFTWMGSPVAPRVLNIGDEPDFIQNHLEAPARGIPAVLLTPRDDDTFVVDPAALARDLLGRARLFILPEHRQTFRITDGLGDRCLSAFFGAARAYYPGFSRHDDPLDHTLLVADRLSDPLMRAAFLGELGRRVAPHQQIPEGIAPPAPPPAPEPEIRPEVAPGPKPEPPPKPVADVGAVSPPAPPPASPARASAGLPASPATQASPATAASQDPAKSEAEPRPDPAPAAPAAPATPAPDPELRGLLEAVLEQVRLTSRESEALRGLVADLRDEVERLSAVSGLRNASTAHIERRLARIEDVLDRTFPDPDAPGPDGDAPWGPGGSPGAGEGSGADAAEGEGSSESAPDTLQEVVQAAAERHADALLILPAAVDAARQSPYEDPERVREILKVMASISRRRQEGALGTSLKEAFEAYGVDYRGGIAPSTSERLRGQYLFHLEGGEGVECFEHIALGGTYSPRRCLRIYFSSKLVTDSRFVIGHVGRHFEVMTST